MFEKCQRCKSERVASIGGKCSDCSSTSLRGRERNGYVPGDMGVGGSDYIEFTWCLECGQIQDKFPLPLCKLEEAEEDEEE